MNRQTLAIHSCLPESENGHFTSSAAPIEMSASFHYHDARDLTAVANGELEGFVYQRYGNPTAAMLQRQMSAIEGGATAVASSSGMAAMHMGLMTVLHERPRLVLGADVLFGQTYQLLQLMEQQGVDARYVDMCDLGQVESALDRHEVGCLLLETVSNPSLRVAPLDDICRLAKARGVPVLVDATFTTPVMSRPIEVGASVVVHSATKYLAGHADVLGGISLCDAEHSEFMTGLGRHLGANLGPFHCFLTSRGIKTLPMRFEEHCRNAMHVARVLEAHPRVERVHYPGLESHADKQVADRLFDCDADRARMYGGMVAFEVPDAGRSETFQFMNQLHFVVRTPSLGDIHSLITHPATTTHRNLSPKRREQLGIGENLVRLSVGIEDRDDIANDIVQALESLS